MIYIFLIIIIVLLFIILYSVKGRSSVFNKAFEKINVPEFVKNDERNTTYPNEYVKLGISYMKRHEAVKEFERLSSLYGDETENIINNKK